MQKDDPTESDDDARGTARERGYRTDEVRRSRFEDPYGEGQQYSHSRFAEDDYDPAQYGRSESRRSSRGHERGPFYGSLSFRAYGGRLGGYGEPPSGEYDDARDRHFRRGPKGYVRSDARIEEEIAASLWKAWQIDSSDVSLQVKGGNVFLSGTVPERWMKYDIENTVDECPGVREIDNQIRVEERRASAAR